MTLEVLSPPAFPCLIDSIQTLYYELMVGGRSHQPNYHCLKGQILTFNALKSMEIIKLSLIDFFLWEDLQKE